MITSMTGFARRETTGAWGTLVCELRSVNHRFLEAGFRLPDELRSGEGELRARLARRLRRGKVDCTMNYRRPQGNGVALEVNSEALAQVLAAVDVVARSLPESVSVSALDVLRWPGVLREEPADIAALHGEVRAVFEETVQSLSAARSREGQRLAELILQRCEALAALIAQVRARLPE
ncbi:MAG TPA: YicC/YloC family endoribonuclease, partial [Steroidobacteraceae bacterium]|nr:YicC/YloC family endoribonuclease [Steroidobacteraceae bacterium]